MNFREASYLLQTEMLKLSRILLDNQEFQFLSRNTSSSHWVIPLPVWNVERIFLVFFNSLAWERTLLSEISFLFSIENFHFVLQDADSGKFMKSQRMNESYLFQVTAPALGWKGYWLSAEEISPEISCQDGDVASLPSLSNEQFQLEWENPKQHFFPTFTIFEKMLLKKEEYIKWQGYFTYLPAGSGVYNFENSLHLYFWVGSIPGSLFGFLCGILAQRLGLIRKIIQAIIYFSGLFQGQRQTHQSRKRIQKENSTEFYWRVFRLMLLFGIGMGFSSKIFFFLIHSADLDTKIEISTGTQILWLYSFTMGSLFLPFYALFSLLFPFATYLYLFLFTPHHIAIPLQLTKSQQFSIQICRGDLVEQARISLGAHSDLLKIVRLHKKIPEKIPHIEFQYHIHPSYANGQLVSRFHFKQNREIEAHKIKKTFIETGFEWTEVPPFQPTRGINGNYYPLVSQAVVNHVAITASHSLGMGTLDDSYVEFMLHRRFQQEGQDLLIEDPSNTDLTLLIGKTTEENHKVIRNRKLRDLDMDLNFPFEVVFDFQYEKNNMEKKDLHCSATSLFSNFNLWREVDIFSLRVLKIENHQIKYLIRFLRMTEDHSASFSFLSLFAVESCQPKCIVETDLTGLVERKSYSVKTEITLVIGEMKIFTFFCSDVNTAEFLNKIQ